MKHRLDRFFKLAAIIICLAVLFSFLFVSFGAHHDCVGENCTVCMLMAVCRHLSETAFLIFTVLRISASTVRYNAYCAARKCGMIDTTPVSLKVKLSN